MEASRRGAVDRGGLSLGGMGAFMSSVICCLRVSTGYCLVHLLRQHLAAQTLVMALHCGGKLALALGGRLFVVLARAQLGEKAGLLPGALETAHRHLERLGFPCASCRHKSRS